MGHSIGESVVHETSIAAIVTPVAVNELLLGERHELTLGDEVGTFERSSGGERPA